MMTVNEATRMITITNAAVILPMSNHGTCAEAVDVVESIIFVELHEKIAEENERKKEGTKGRD